MMRLNLTRTQSPHARVRWGFHPERRMLDADGEMLGQASLRLMQESGREPVLEAGVLDHHVRRQHRQLADAPVPGRSDALLYEAT